MKLPVFRILLLILLAPTFCLAGAVLAAFILALMMPSGHHHY